MSEQAAGPVADRLSTGRLLAYAAPTVALQAVLTPLYVFLPPVYYSAEVGLSVAMVTLAFFVGRFWEALVDPLVGALSDRTRSRFGRRRIWMLLGTPIVLVAAWFLLLPPQGASFLHLVVWLAVFYAGWTMVYVPHQTWGGELSEDYAERSRIAGFRESGAFLGFLCATVVGIVYWNFYRGIAAPSYAQIVMAVGVFFAVSLPIAVLWCFARVPATAAAAHRTPGWGETLAILRRNAPFRRLAGAYLIDRIAMGAYFAVQPALISQALGIPDQVLVVALVNTVAAALLAFQWVRIANALGKHRAYCLANGITALAYLLLFVVPAGVAWPVLAVNVLMAFGNGGTMITPPAMTADAVDADELESGVAQMGGHTALLACVFKLGMGLGLVVGLQFLEVFGYAGMGQPLAPETAQGVRLGASVLPAALLLVPIALMWRYPIDAARHAAIRAGLAARRAAEVR
jgi:Na+/melibiose symporter-like transporter